MTRDYHHGDRIHLDGHPTPATIDSTHISTHGTTHNATLDNGTSISDIPEHNIHPIHPAPTTHTHHATSLYKKDDRITYTNPRGRTHPGRITQPLYITPTPTYDIALDNGDEITDVPEANIHPETNHELLTPGTHIQYADHIGDDNHYKGTIVKHLTNYTPTRYEILWDDGHHSTTTEPAKNLRILPPPTHTPTFTPLIFTPRQD